MPPEVPVVSVSSQMIAVLPSIFSECLSTLRVDVFANAMSPLKWWCANGQRQVEYDRGAVDRQLHVEGHAI